jgi:hypothetical protein
MLEREAKTSGLRGGLLADKMGYGKTATAIGLISRDLGLPPPAGQAEGGEYIQGRATLILAPPHLVEQWEGEFVKFLGDGAVELWRPLGKFPLAQDCKAETTSKIPLQIGGQDCGIVCNAQSIITSVAEDSLLPELRVGDKLSQVIVHFPPGQPKMVPRGRDQNGQPIMRAVDHDSLCASYFREGICNGLPGLPTYSYRLHLPGRLEVPRHVSDVAPGSTASVRVLRPNDASLGQVMTKVRGSGSLRILTVTSPQEHGNLQLRQFAEDFDAVICSTSVISCPYYSTRLSHLCRQFCTAQGEEVKYLTSQRLAILHKAVKQWKSTPESLARALASHQPPLEVIKWRRVVLDEFHESAGWPSMVREFAKGLVGEYRWGLSGTPPLGGTEQAMEVADLLLYPRLEHAPATAETLEAIAPGTVKQTREKWLASNFNKDAVRAEMEGFVRECVRQNASSLVEKIGVIEHVVFTAHTPHERAIYRQACHDAEIFNLEDGYENVSLNARQVLLQRCAHFCLDKEAPDAEGAMRRLGDVKRQRVSDTQTQLQIEASRAAALGAWPAAAAALRAALPLRHAEAAKFAESILERDLASLIIKP